MQCVIVPDELSVHVFQAYNIFRVVTDAPARGQFIPMNREITAVPRKILRCFSHCTPTGHIKRCSHAVMLLWIIQMPLYDICWLELTSGAHRFRLCMFFFFFFLSNWSQAPGDCLAGRLERCLWHAPTETAPASPHNVAIRQGAWQLDKREFLPVTNYREQSNFRVLQKKRPQCTLDVSQLC